MMKYVIKLEINGIEFQIKTLAGSEREAKDKAWDVIIERTSFISIRPEAIMEVNRSFSQKMVTGFKSALLF
ncbi:hypothetical protein SAMN00777080_2128 [Aquiflexum balticum DSM 16537]|uniref:Uncharacterized protein n=1 Tax=Aquiflexum balticum DSM 16537 TaxID=758820 RepID=A0A1W2H3M3_9BACT|nr:hypothetical protein [Aquiflexum balticum]SMD43535.1 hypothetical protein SAMN00777080_2128 [Aquiflexum balticum DSM 16537]